MDLRSLLEKMTLIESISQAEIDSAVQQLPPGLESPEQKRAKILNDIVWKENLPGLYDPITGYFVRKQQPPIDVGGMYSIADPRFGMDSINKELLSRGLRVGKAGSEGGVSAKPAASGRDEIAAKLERLDHLVKQLKTSSHAVNESFELTISKQLIESFNYSLSEVAASDVVDAVTGNPVTSAAVGTAGVAAAKPLIKIGGKMIPLAGAYLGLMDAKTRYEEGDNTGALLAAISGAAALGGAATSWIWLPIDTYLIANDSAAGKFDGIIAWAKEKLDWDQEDNPTVEVPFPKGGITTEMIARMPEEKARVFKELGWDDPDVIKQYQEDNGIPVTSVIDVATFKALQKSPISDSNTENVVRSSTSEDPSGIINLQKSLVDYGARTADDREFDEDNITGQLDRATIEALQYTLGSLLLVRDSTGKLLKVTGELDPETITAIKSYINS